MNALTKFRNLSVRNKIILIAVVVYAIIPDLVPGPVDDIMAMIVGYILRDENNAINRGVR